MAERLVRCATPWTPLRGKRCRTRVLELIAPRAHLADFAAGLRTDWLSEISDDNTPVEFRDAGRSWRRGLGAVEPYGEARAR